MATGPPVVTASTKRRCFFGISANRIHSPITVNLGKMLGLSRRPFVSSRCVFSSSALWDKSQEYKIQGKGSVVLGCGNIAGLAHGSAVGKDGNSVVLATVVSERTGLDESATDDGTPFNVEYKEKAAASGRIPRTPNRREMPNNENEILTGRAVDRCLRPLFPPLYKFDTQLMASVQAFDSNQPEPPISLVANASSAALCVSDVPWNGPIGCVRVGRVQGVLIAEPSRKQLDESDLDLIYAGTAERTVMIEMSGMEIKGDDLITALRFAHEQIVPVVEAQLRLREERPVEKRSETSFQISMQKSSDSSSTPDLSAHQRTGSWNPLKSFFGANENVGKTGNEIGSIDPTALLKEAKALAASLDRGESRSIFEGRDAERAERAYKEAMLTQRLCGEMQEAKPHWPSSLISYVAHERLWLGMRNSLLDEYAKENTAQCRCDGRRPDDLREITSNMTVLPAVHGSSLFSRGNTQVLCTATLGAAIDSLDTSQKSALGGPVVHGKSFDHLTTLDSSDSESDLRRLMLHYEFPSYCTGEIGKGGGPNRRALGHGALAQKSLDAVMPPAWRFPYVVRLACEVMSSNGSSSMASVCAGTLAMLDAGVPLLAPVAGVSVGLVSRERDNGELEYVLLTDILGLEDHYGDMDFKVSGSRRGVTAMQLDVKLEGGVPLKILEEALEVAKSGRLLILDNMEEEMVSKLPPSPHTSIQNGFDAFMQRGLALKGHAPRVRVVTFAKDRLAFLLGPGGETKRMIEKDHNCMIDLGDAEVGPTGVSTGCVVHVFAPDKASCEAATRVVQELVCDVEDGAILSAVVQEVKEFGAFVEVLRGRTGLLHVSEISNVAKGMAAVDQLKVGDTFDVVCLGSDPLSGAVKLSRRRILDSNDRPKGDAFSKTGSRLNAEFAHRRKKIDGPPQRSPPRPDRKKFAGMVRPLPNPPRSPQDSRPPRDLAK